MKVAVFGLGYVGLVSAACMAEANHDVIGVEVSQEKVDYIMNGKSPVSEPGLQPLVERGVSSGRLRATIDASEAVKVSEVLMVCVGTPSTVTGNIDLSHIREVTRQIGNAISCIEKWRTVVIRSTVVTNTCRDEVISLLEATSGRTHGDGFAVVFYPEFLREGVAIDDFVSPPQAIIGCCEEAHVERLFEGGLVSRDNCQLTSLGLAEFIKYANNAWHGLKVGFANEIGSLSKAMGIDGREVMRILAKETVLNISPAYLRPGFAFGGSCLPKDLRAINKVSEDYSVSTPLLTSVLQSNDAHLERCVQKVLASGATVVGLIGISFKSDTDDMRESPSLKLACRLLEEGVIIKIFIKLKVHMIIT